MTGYGPDSARPTERLMQAWIYQDFWSLEETVLLAHGLSPDDDKAAEVLEKRSVSLSRMKRAQARSGAPEFWLWWAERNNMPFHTDWWLAITPGGPIGFDGRHFAHHRREMLSSEYLQQERRLIGKWARKPYWTAREAIDLSLNFEPFSTESWRGDAPETGETIRERDDRFRVLERALEIREINEKSSAKVYLLWLKQRGYYVSPAWQRAVGIVDQRPQKSASIEPAELVAENAELQELLRVKDERLLALEAQLKASSAAGDSRAQKSANTMRIASLQKALIACAVDGYGYTPRQMRSDVPKQIADKAVELGCGLNQQTVRKLLKDACRQ